MLARVRRAVVVEVAEAGGGGTGSLCSPGSVNHWTQCLLLIPH